MEISMRKFTEIPKHNQCACLRSFFSPSRKNDSDNMDFSACLPGLKILALVSETRLGFSAWANIQPRLKPFPCNYHLHFKRISFRNRAEVSARLIYLAKVWTMIFCMVFSINQGKLWYPGTMMICKFRSEHSSAAFEAYAPTNSYQFHHISVAIWLSHLFRSGTKNL